MIETDAQRRWWFATHPEYSSSRKGRESREHQEENDGEEAVSPEEVDAYVDEMLQYAHGPVADLLKSVKRNFGTEGETLRPDQRLAFLNDPGHTSDGAAGSFKEDDEGAEPGFWDAVAKGIDNTLRDWERWFGFSLGLTNPSRKLGREMEKAGRPRPSDYHDAHHVVPAKDSRFPEAEESRKILEKFGIDLYNEANGVWLPRKAGIDPGAAYHPGVHTGLYYRQVEKLLRGATSKEEAIEILRDIGRELSKGTFRK